MAKFYGDVGYGISTEIAPGVWEDVITARKYFGDILSRSVKKTDENVGGEIIVNNEISIVADPFANNHFFAIRYVEWAGAFWTVTEVTVESPRLLLRIGGIYNGPKA